MLQFKPIMFDELNFAVSAVLCNLHKIIVPDLQLSNYQDYLKNFSLTMANNWEVFKSLEELQEFLSSNNIERLYQGIINSIEFNY